MKYVKDADPEKFKYCSDRESPSPIPFMVHLPTSPN
jgi:hypothetical protein